MSADYNQEINSAKDAIAAAGGLFTLRIFSPEDNSTKAWRPGTSTYTDMVDLIGVFLHYDQKHVDGTNIQSGDQKILLSASGLALSPNLNAQAIRDNEIWSIVKIRELNPAGTPIIYILQVRK